MNNFGAYLTPEEAQAKDLSTKNGRREPLSYYEILAMNNETCENCNEKAWRLANTGLCFSCTTGEADASDDYEINAAT